MAVDVRPATDADLPDVLNVLDGAALETDYDQVRERVACDDVLVAVPTGNDEPVVGVCVLAGEAMLAIAVRRRRRDRGIGRALLSAAASGRSRLVAECDPDVAPFYEAVGFDVRRLAEGRLVGVLDPAEPNPG